MMLNQRVRLALVEARAQGFQSNGQEGERAEEGALDHRGKKPACIYRQWRKRVCEIAIHIEAEVSTIGCVCDWSQRHFSQEFIVTLGAYVASQTTAHHSEQHWAVPSHNRVQ